MLLLYFEIIFKKTKSNLQGKTLLENHKNNINSYECNILVD